MSKIKLVPRPDMQGKEGKKVFMLSVMEGRRFTTNDTLHPEKAAAADLIHWDSSFGNCPVREGNDPWNWRGFKYLHELGEQQWYEDLDMVGKACYFWDEGAENQKTIGIFSRKSLLSGRPFVTNDGDDYEYAEPVTASDLYQEQV